jgi:hypothetical protein
VNETHTPLAVWERRIRKFRQPFGKFVAAGELKPVPLQFEKVLAQFRISLNNSPPPVVFRNTPIDFYRKRGG